MFKNRVKRVVSGVIMRSLKLPQLVGLTPRNRNLRVMDLAILKHLETPMTDEQLTRAYNRVRNRDKAKYASISRRRSYLVANGFVHDTGAVTKSKYGKNMTLWSTTLMK